MKNDIQIEDLYYKYLKVAFLLKKEDSILSFKNRYLKLVDKEKNILYFINVEYYLDKFLEEYNLSK